MMGSQCIHVVDFLQFLLLNTVICVVYLSLPFSIARCISLDILYVQNKIFVNLCRIQKASGKASEISKNLKSGNKTVNQFHSRILMQHQFPHSTLMRLNIPMICSVSICLFSSPALSRITLPSCIIMSLLPYSMA